MRNAWSFSPWPGGTLLGGGFLLLGPAGVSRRFQCLVRDRHGFDAVFAACQNSFILASASIPAGSRWMAGLVW